MQRADQTAGQGFTLIELSTVLVIIGLIVGGVLVGQDLIRAAAVRQQITQIEKYQTATNAFREKYSYLPGDIKDPAASSFGFQPRGAGAGEGDGNGLIEGTQTAGVGPVNDGSEAGEPTAFWVDLSTAKLIEDSFTTASPSGMGGGFSAVYLPLYFPKAKIGQGNYIYVYPYNGIDYYGLASLANIGTFGYPNSSPALTVTQAAAIDRKIDDGFPQTGNVIAMYLWAYQTYNWASGNYGTAATPGSSTTCFDNSSTTVGTPGISGATQHYSVEISNGSNVNCALSFRFQ